MRVTLYIYGQMLDERADHRYPAPVQREISRSKCGHLDPSQDAKEQQLDQFPITLMFHPAGQIEHPRPLEGLVLTSCHE